ncbi:MAG TPA: bifunctional diaminohydroxyphosphoribosylaminopyrimidine deaminase/5-amino-6-(5-phosphoribosylamino)uracil reductase RibD [Chitinophagaceae bacterium]|nr:bifunctional diaminohydroxyphosphoribosylaminopyrimidine deaminase/5-amino-6-(5-phosphoribosylamino)uracil reductase RibD [Chitinophagaceae bacterium]
MPIDHAHYMRRCFELALLGAGYVAPNPMVGSVLVHNDRIIGEGWHQRYGQAHAEVNCIASVKEEDKHLITSSTMYVSLEPCAHYGKTPPCADLIVRNHIPHVVIGCRDPFGEVNGKGIDKLKAAGVNVEVGILEEEAKELNKRFFTFHTQHRPYVILKWAQTADSFIAAHPVNNNGKTDRLLISNDLSNRMVHRWRSEEASILVGTNTALLDNPALTNRLWDGPSPVRLVVDMELQLPHELQLFDRSQHTIVFNTIKHEEEGNLLYYQVTHDVNLIPQMMNALYQLQLQSVLVEGGAVLLQSFITENCWDEARVIVNNDLFIKKGLPAPVINGIAHEITQLKNDTLLLYNRQ